MSWSRVSLLIVIMLLLVVLLLFVVDFLVRRSSFTASDGDVVLWQGLAYYVGADSVGQWGRVTLTDHRLNFAAAPFQVHRIDDEITGKTIRGPFAKLSIGWGVVHHSCGLPGVRFMQATGRGMETRMVLTVARKSLLAQLVAISNRLQ